MINHDDFQNEIEMNIKIEDIFFNQKTVKKHLQHLFKHDPIM